MRFNFRNRYIVGVTVDPDAQNFDDNLLKLIFLAFMHMAYDGSLSASDASMDVVIWQEGQGYSSRTIGDASVLVIPTEMFETFIDMLEHGKPFVDLSRRGKDIVLFGVGSAEFCQSFIHYVATDDNGASAKSWGLHYMRKLTTAKLSDTLWYDTATPGEFLHYNLKKMIKNFTEYMAAA